MIHVRFISLAVVLTVLCSSCAQPAAIVDPEPEAAPAGIKFSDAAPTLAALAARAHADLTWRDADGAAFFLWVKTQKSPGHWSFTLDRAYRIQQADKIVWAFIDPASGDNLRFQDAVGDFMAFKHIRESIMCPATDAHDGNQSTAEILSERKDGAAVIKIVYASIGAPRLYNEDMRTILLYRSPAGAWQLATRNLGHEGMYSHGSVPSSDYFDIQIAWNGPKSVTPFHAAVTQLRSHFPNRENEDTPNYTSRSDGVLAGTFPMALKMPERRYILADGKLTLAALADTLIYYHSSWWNADWVASPAVTRAEIRKLWLAALQKGNPGVAADKPVAKDAAIILPDESATATAVYKRLAPGARLPALSLSPCIAELGNL